MQFFYSSTSLGDIACYKKEVKNTIPVVFLHGVYFDNRLWTYHQKKINSHTTISIDMPRHGKSRNIIKKNWNLTDCRDMLLELIDALGYKKVYAIGHSWGSMTILRAAAKDPSKFEALGLCNMPLHKSQSSAKLQFGLQHLMLSLRSFYSKKVAQFMFAKSSLESNTSIMPYLKICMLNMKAADINHTDKAVILNSDDGHHYLEKLEVPLMTLRGEQDYVSDSPLKESIVVPGAHVSPLECPEQVHTFIGRLISTKKDSIIAHEVTK